jgi:hypothetical protein
MPVKATVERCRILILPRISADPYKCSATPTTHHQRQMLFAEIQTARRSFQEEVDDETAAICFIFECKYQSD